MPKTRYDYENQHKEDVKKIEELEAEIKRLENELAYYQYKNNAHKIINERGAGRKTKLTPYTLKVVSQYRTQGKSQREIAELLDISVGLVNKACKTLES
jgi:hypothetical protein